MVNCEYFDLFYKDNTNKKAKIEYSGGVITNTELFQNSEELTESLCSEKELRFGYCEASSFKFKVANIVKPMKGETVTFSIVIDHHEDKPLLIGKYKVESDKETADRRYRDIVAYDAMYDIINADPSDMAVWYNTVLPEESSAVTMKQFRESFVRHFGLTEVLPKIGEDNAGNPIYGLVNDSMTVERTIDPGEISGKTIITCICEINGCFGHIGRDGKFHFIYLPQAIEGLYPSNDLYPDHAPEWMAQAKTGHLYPQDPKSTRIGKGSYIPPCNYESYRTIPITKLQIRKEENDIGKIWPEGEIEEKDNCYIIQNNFLVYGKSSDELEIIAQNILSKITDIIYRPFDCTAVGNPCLEVGDPIRLSTKYDIVESYILSRTLKGIQAMRDTYKATGVKKYGAKANGIHESIIQLKGKTNTLMRNVEETRMEIKDVEKNLSNEISITAAGLSADINAEKTRAEGEEAKLSNSIKVTADGLQANIDKETTRATGEEEKLSTSVTALAGQVVLKVKSNGEIASVQLEAKPDSGTVFKVKAGNMQLTAEEAISLMAGGDLNLTGKNITIKSNNFSVDANGNAECRNITAFSISGNAVNQFNNTLKESQAIILANQAIENANNSIAALNQVVNHLNNVAFPEINGLIEQLQQKVAILDARVSILEAKS